MSGYTRNRRRFNPKKGIRSFQDLEVYQRALEGSVVITKKLEPILREEDYLLREELVRCSLTIAYLIAESHSCRFDPSQKGLKLLHQSMDKTNKLIVLLEQIRDIYPNKIERSTIRELIKKYQSNRIKTWRLYKAWRKFLKEK